MPAAERHDPTHGQIDFDIQDHVEAMGCTGGVAQVVAIERTLQDRRDRGEVVLGAVRPQAPAADLVNHPPHYTAHPSGVECITITEHMGFNLGNAVKYIWRADLKGDAMEDLRKAAWYVEREIARRERTSSVERQP